MSHYLVNTRNQAESTELSRFPLRAGPLGRRACQRRDTNRSRRGRPTWMLSQKPENNPKLELMPEVLVKDQSKYGGQKHESKPDMLIEDGSTCQSSRILTLLSNVNIKTITQFQSTVELLKKSLAFFCKIECQCSHQIFGLSWL